jgi:hypothetical protein
MLIGQFDVPALSFLSFKGLEQPLNTCVNLLNENYDLRIIICRSEWRQQLSIICKCYCYYKLWLTHYHLQVGVTPTIINYLRQAIQSPCGLDTLDYTMCCEGWVQIKRQTFYIIVLIRIIVIIRDKLTT